VHVDFSALAIGDAVTLETLAFDPMHVENAVADKAADRTPATQATAPQRARPDPHAGHGSLAEGVRAPVMTFAVRTRATSTGRVPATLSSLAAPAADGATERPLRLGLRQGAMAHQRPRVRDGQLPIEVARGARELWLFRNYHTSMPHAMHLHGFPMRVRRPAKTFARLHRRARRRRPGRLPTDLGRKDTVLVWPGETGARGRRLRASLGASRRTTWCIATTSSTRTAG
jgi:FtsP/CotA-like multicopper oxidase with cupredoxin domain